MCQAYNQQYGTNFIPTVLTNTYGPRDNFDSVDSHVIPSLIGKFHKAKINNHPCVTVWGSGNPHREFIYVDDVVDAVIFLMDKYNDSEIINISVGSNLTIREISNLIKEVVGYMGKIVFGTSKADGIPKKMLDATKLKKLGWQAKISLKDGVEKTYKWYLKNYKDAQN